MVPYLKQTPIVGNRTIYFPGELVNLFYEETYSPYQVVDMADQVGFVRCCVRPLWKITFQWSNAWLLSFFPDFQEFD